MTKYVFQESIFAADDTVSIAPFAQLTVTESATGDAAELWEDAEGLEPISGNVVLADEFGFVRFYVSMGMYDVEILSGGESRTLVDLDIGGSAAAQSAAAASAASAAAALLSEQAADASADASEAFADNAEQSANDAAAHSATAESYKNQAEAARDAAVVNAQLYASEALGRAAVADGQTFNVQSADGEVAAYIYRRVNSTTSTQIGTLASAVAAGYNLTSDSGYVMAHTDSDGNVALAITDAGITEIARVQVGGTGNSQISEDTDGDLRIDADGIKIGDTMRQIELEILYGDFAGAAELAVDADGNVAFAVLADGSITYPGLTLAPGTIEFQEMIMLPDGAQGQNPNGGWTCTGMTRRPDGIWIISNDGRTDEASTNYQCSIVFVTPDFRRIFLEIPVNTVSYPGIRSVQGIAYDSSDETIWFVDRQNQMIRHIQQDGTKLIDEITVAYTPNGLAYNPTTDELFLSNEDDTTVRVIDAATGTESRSISLSWNADQLFYDADNDHLYYTYGDNGTDGNFRIINATTGNTVRNFEGLPHAQAIEGIYADAGTLYISNDGGFHVNADPPLSMIIKYDYRA